MEQARRELMKTTHATRSAKGHTWGPIGRGETSQRAGKSGTVWRAWKRVSAARLDTGRRLCRASHGRLGWPLDQCTSFSAARSLMVTRAGRYSGELPSNRDGSDTCARLREGGVEPPHIPVSGRLLGDQERPTRIAARCASNPIGHIPRISVSAFHAAASLMKTPAGPRTRNFPCNGALPLSYVASLNGGARPSSPSAAQLLPQKRPEELACLIGARAPLMVRPGRLELPTRRIEAGCSVQLSYGRCIGEAPLAPLAQDGFDENSASLKGGAASAMASTASELSRTVDETHRRPADGSGLAHQRTTQRACDGPGNRKRRLVSPQQNDAGQEGHSGCGEDQGAHLGGLLAFGGLLIEPTPLLGHFTQRQPLIGLDQR